MTVRNLLVVSSGLGDAGIIMEINKVELWQCANMLAIAMYEMGAADIRYSTDQQALTDAVSNLEKGSLGEHFKKSLNTLPPHKFMWISAVDDNEKIISIAAGRLDDTGSWSLQKYIHEHFARVVVGIDGKPARLSPTSTLFAKEISGRCAYLGEGYADPQWRKKGISSLLFKYLLLIVWDEWRPEILYSWIRRVQIERGTAAHWGFTESYETPLEFECPPSDVDWSNTFFVGLRKIGIHQMIRTLKAQEKKEALNNKAEDLIPPLF